MFSHIMLGANDLEVSKAFYDAVLGKLGAKPGVLSPNAHGHKRYFYFLSGSIFIITEPINDEPASHGNGSTIGFKADSPEDADAWHAAGVANGGKAIEVPPGIREGNGMKLYLAYLLDPAGNKICAMHTVR